jgi:putative transposase
MARRGAGSDDVGRVRFQAALAEPLPHGRLRGIAFVVVARCTAIAPRTRLGPPAYVRSDNGPEFIAIALREWIAAVGSQTAYIAPGSPWGNGYCESFNSKLGEELLDGEIFYSLAEAQILIEVWLRHYNGVRPHSSLNYQPPAPESFVPRSGSIVPWASAPAVEGPRSPTPNMALETAVH